MYKVHIPTTQYGFIEVECENLDDAIAEHQNITLAFDDKEGLNQNQWAKVRDTYLHTGEIFPEDTEQMSKLQRYVINQIKLGLNSKKYGTE